MRRKNSMWNEKNEKTVQARIITTKSNKNICFSDSYKTKYKKTTRKTMFYWRLLGTYKRKIRPSVMQSCGWFDREWPNSKPQSEGILTAITGSRKRPSTEHNEGFVIGMQYRHERCQFPSLDVSRLSTLLPTSLHVLLISSGYHIETETWLSVRCL